MDDYANVLVRRHIFGSLVIAAVAHGQCSASGNDCLDVLLSEASIIVVADYLGTATVIRWLLSKNISYPGTVYVTKETWMLAWLCIEEDERAKHGAFLSEAHMRDVERITYLIGVGERKVVYEGFSSFTIAAGLSEETPYFVEFKISTDSSEVAFISSSGKGADESLYNFEMRSYDLGYKRMMSPCLPFGVTVSASCAGLMYGAILEVMNRTKRRVVIVSPIGRKSLMLANLYFGYLSAFSVFKRPRRSYSFSKWEEEGRICIFEEVVAGVLDLMQDKVHLIIPIEGKGYPEAIATTAVSEAYTVQRTAAIGGESAEQLVLSTCPRACFAAVEYRATLQHGRILVRCREGQQSLLKESFKGREFVRGPLRVQDVIGKLVKCQYFTYDLVGDPDRGAIVLRIDRLRAELVFRQEETEIVVDCIDDIPKILKIVQ